MEKRGEYRGIARVLLDGPDYQKLPERARHIFLDLKISFGPAGIEVVYPEALRAELTAKSGMPSKAVDQALAQLEGDWIQIDGNLVWIIGQLRFDPHMKVSNANHRQSIQGHIRGLPRRPIVTEFIRYYRPWFENAPDLLSPLGNAIPNAMGDAMPNATEITRPMTDDITEDKTNTENSTDARRRVPAREESGAQLPGNLEQAADLVIMAANRGLGEVLGEAFNPIPVGHGSRQDVLDWLSSIPFDVVQGAVYEAAKRYKPNGRHRQIHTMKYFDDAVKEAHDRQLAGGVNVKPSRRRGPRQYDYSNPTNEFKGLKL